ncbi:MAG: PAS domain S-box protein [Desulfovibrio sp.]
MKLQSRNKRQPFNRLWVAVTASLALVACFYLLLFAFLADRQHAEQMEERSQGLRRVLSVAHGGVEPLLREVRNGRLDTDQGRTRVAELLWGMRYQEDGLSNYIFLLTDDGVLLVDPTQPEMVGTNLWDMRDDSGNRVIREMIRTARENPNGAFIRYLKRQPNSGQPKSKMAFVLPLPEIDCLMGTGTYVADLEAKARKETLRTGLLVGVLFLLGFVPLVLPLREAARRNAALAREIAGHECTERSLRHAESRYRMISARPGQVVYDMDLGSGKTVWSGDAAGVSGHSLEEYGQGGDRFFAGEIHPDEQEEVLALWKEAVRLGREWNAVFRLRRKDEGYVYVEDHAGFLTAEAGGEPVRMIGSLRNVDALVRAGEEVRRSEAKYRALAENFPNGAVLLFDDELRFLLADGAGLKSVGFADGGMIGRTPGEVFPPSVARAAERYFRKALRGEEHVFEMTYAGRIFRLHALPVRGGNSQRGVVAEGMAVIQDVTANKLAEKALSESERRLSTLIMNMPGMVYRSAFHSDWTLEFVSPGCRALTGYGPESLLYNRAKSWNALVHPDDRERLKREVARALAGERPFELSYRIVTQSGERKWVWERCVGISGEEGVPVIEGIILDVTDRKLAEEGLARSLAYETVLNSCATLLLSSARQQDALDQILSELRAATSACRAYVFENYSDADGKLCYRLSFESVLAGVSRLRDVPELRGARYDEIIPRWRNLFEQGEIIQSLFRDLPRIEQQELARYDIKSLLALPLRVEGRWSGFIGFDDTRNEREWSEAERLFLRTATDMIGAFMERRQAEQRLLQAHGELDQIFNSTGDGMALLGLDGTVQRLNRTMAEMFGLDPGAAQGGRCCEIIPDDRCQADACPLVQLRAGTERTGHVFCKPELDGSLRHFRSVSTPFRNVGGEVVGVVVSVREITQRVRAQEESKERERQLIQADKLAALGTLVSGVAHEINNPNGIITLNAPTLREIWRGVRPILEERFDERGDFLLGELEYSVIRDEADALFDQIVESARRIKRIVSELKGFARQDVAGRDQIVNINDVAQAAAGLVTNKIKKCTNRFEAVWSEKPVRVLGNFQRLEQVLVNALINACEALTDPEQAVILRVGASPDGKFAQITVTDEGRGMTPDDIRHVFEPFFTTKRDNGGTGLGLSVSHGIIEEHGGRMYFLSEPRKGTVCTVELPLLSGEGSA